MLMQLAGVSVLRHTDPTGPLGLWGAKPVRALDTITLTVRAGETLGVMGGSGSGKTTLAETMTLRRPYDRGRMLLDGRDVARMGRGERERFRRRLQIIRQDPREGLELDRAVGRQWQEQMHRYGLSDAAVAVSRALERVGLEAEILDRTPATLSGGQQQRLAIARALSLNPLLVAADEPFSGVDPHLASDLIRMMRQVQQQQRLTLLLISQKRQIIGRMADRTAVLYAGRLLEVGPTARMLDGGTHPHTRLFLGQTGDVLPPEGDRAGRPQAGCPWAPHCPLASARCREEMPALREISAGHMVACHAL